MLDVRTIQEPSGRRCFDQPDDRRDFLRRHLAAVSPFLEYRVAEVLSGRVRDFFTQPQSVAAIEDALQGPGNVIQRDQYPDAHVVDPSSYCLNHLTNHFPAQGFIAPRIEYGLLPRCTVHFCLNGCVTSHEKGDWEDRRISIIIPARDIHDKAEVFLPQDVRYFGRFALPESAVVIVPKGMPVPKDVGFRVESYPYSSADEIRGITAQRMFDMGFLPVRIGAWSWESDLYRTKSLSGGSSQGNPGNICHQLGTFVMGGFFPDEAVRLCSIASLLGAERLCLNDLHDSNYQDEVRIMDPFIRVYDFARRRVREALSPAEFDCRFPSGFLPVLGPGDDFWGTRGSRIWCETDVRKAYVTEQVEGYRLRIRNLVVSAR